MGFQSPQFDFIDQRFRHLRGKNLEVICNEDVQATSAVPTLITPLDGVSIASIIDLSTGQLQPGVSLVVTDVDAGVAVVPNKVCNVFVITFVVVNASGTPLTPSLTSTVADAVDCPGAGTGHSQSVVQKHDIQIHFCVLPVDADENGIFDTLYATADVEYCLVVANEKILKLEAARPFCP